MKDQASTAAALGLLTRHAGTLAAGYVLADGADSESAIETISAIVTAVVIIGWSWVEKLRRR